MNHLRVLSYTALVCFFFIGTGCGKEHAVVNRSKPIIDTPADTATNKPILTLPERQVKVYIGISDRWHELADPANYSQWTYVRTNSTGFYTNFIAMWINKYQNTEDPQQSCNNMRKAFVNNGCFFETSLETSVNTDTNGVNNQATDMRSIDMLNAAGFQVQSASLNYGVTPDRVSTLRTYHGNRNCLALEGPWTIGGDILSDASSGNAPIRQAIQASDGVETDGPMGLWAGNSGDMQQGSYSLAKFAASKNELSAIMLAPADGGVTTYNATNQFFTTAKQCVLGHEDNNASPDIWTIWTYGESANEPTFPESVISSNGQVAPANTMIGVGYWLLKHLNNQPQLLLKDTGSVSSAATVHLIGHSGATLILNKKVGNSVSYTMPIIFSNSNDPQIEASPVIRAIISGVASNWIITFSVGGTDVTGDVIYNGGLNCIGTKRISNTNNLTLTMKITAKNTATTSPVSIKLETMSNISNTKNTADYTITSKVQ